MSSGPGGDPTAYGVLTGGGFADAWSSGPVTCCHKNDLHADRTASGLWPSDHAGVVATLQLPS